MDDGLMKKLRLVGGMKAVVLNPPDDYDILDALGLPETAGCSANTELDSAAYDYIQLFVVSLAELERFAAKAAGALAEDGLLWLAYPKGTSGVKTDINRDTGWQFMKTLGMEGVSNISISDKWSAVRYRPASAVKKRPSRARQSDAADSGRAMSGDTALPDMPRELEAAMKQSPAASEFYNSLTVSMKRDYLRWVLDAKREDTRMKRAAFSVEKLERGLKRPTDK